VDDDSWFTSRGSATPWKPPSESIRTAGSGCRVVGELGVGDDDGCGCGGGDGDATWVMSWVATAWSDAPSGAVGGCWITGG